MESTVLAPGEIAPFGYLYVVARGLVLFGGRVLMEGSSWGDDIILHNPDHHAQCRARAMSYVDAHTLSREVLVKVLSAFPAASEKVPGRECAFGLVIGLRLLFILNSALNLALDWP